MRARLRASPSLVAPNRRGSRVLASPATRLAQYPGSPSRTRNTGPAPTAPATPLIRIGQIRRLAKRSRHRVEAAGVAPGSVSTRGCARCGSWAARNRLVLATGLAASLPVIVSVVGTLSDSWVPLTDNALIALRSYDVLTTHPPLLGQCSAVSVAEVGAVYSLGPLLYWPLALPARFIGPVGFPLTIGVINVAAVMSVVALARRRGGSLLMFATALAVVVMCRSLPTEVLDPFNPGAALLPFTLLIFLCWSLACGEYRLLPITVVVASFVVQCHLTYLLPTLGMLAVGGAGLAWRLLRGREAKPGGRPRRWLLASLLVGLVCWSAPLLDQVVHRPGNLVALERTARAHQPDVGPASGWRGQCARSGSRPGGNDARGHLSSATSTPPRIPAYLASPRSRSS